MRISRPAVLVPFLALAASSCGPPPADLVLTNGDVYTVEEGQPWARSIVITGNTITAVLEDEQEAEEPVERWGPDRFTIDDLTRNNPCFLSSYDGDLYLANTAALQAAGLEEATLEGMQLREGIPTGLIYRGSPTIARIREVVQPKSEERIMNEYRTGLEKRAEIAVIDRNIIDNSDEILNMEIEMTIVDGRVVFER